MIKKLLTVAVLVAAINFLAIAGGVAYLLVTGVVTREKVDAILATLYPPAEEPRPVEPTAESELPMLKLDELLAEHAGKPVSEQLELMRNAFDAQAAQLERQGRELIDLRKQVLLAQEQVAKDRKKLDEREAAIASREKAQQMAANDAGFKASLEIYNALPAATVKQIFSRLDDATVVRFLQAMEPRRVSKILTEYTAPAEVERAQVWLERLRKNDLSPEATASLDTQPTGRP